MGANVLARRTPLIAIALLIAIGAGWWFFGRETGVRPPVGPPDGGGETPVEVGTDPTDPGTFDPVDPIATTPPTIPDGPRLEAMGQVVDHSTGRGVSGATVTITESLDARVQPLAHVRTLSTGVFVKDFPERDEFQLTVRADGYAPARWEVVDGMTPSGIPFELANLDLPIAPESVLWVHTQIDGLDPEDRVIVDFQLRQARTPAELGTPLMQKGNAAMVGPETRIGKLASGKYLLSFRTSRQRLGSQEIELGLGEEKTVEFTLGPPVPIDGVVRHNGRPVTGGRLGVWGRENHSNTTAMIDDSGHFSVSLPAPGRYSFAFSPSRETLDDGTGGSQELLIEKSGRVDLEFLSSRLVGHVVGPVGEPLPEVSGTLFGPQALSFITDDAGYFELNDVPHGAYRWLFPNAPLDSFGPSRVFEVTGDSEVEYRFEDSTDLEVIVRRDPDPTTSNEVGRPQISLLEATGQLTPLRPSTRENHYQWPVEGGLGVVVQRGWAPCFFELPPSEHPNPQSVVLTPGGELTVTLVPDRGRASKLIRFTIEPLEAPELPHEWCDRQTGPSGSARVTLPPGSYRISADLGDGLVSTEIEVHARAETEARLP